MRAADVPGHRHRDRDGQEGPARLHRRATTRRRSRAASSTPTRTTNLRYSQMAPLDMYEEKNTGTNLPGADRALRRAAATSTSFLFMAKGGGSANKTLPLPGDEGAPQPRERCSTFLDEKIRTLGTAACPPYHLAIVDRRHVGRVHAQDREARELRATSTRCRRRGNALGRAFRDLELEEQVLELTQRIGIGAQFGGKYFCHDVRVIRLPRHGASLPGRHRRVVLGRPPGARQDHARRRLPRAARDEPGAVPARDRRDDELARRRRARSTCAGRWREIRADALAATRSRRGSRSPAR